MIKAIIVFFGMCCLIVSGPSIAGTDDNILDEITIRMISNESLPIDVTNIELPDVNDDHASGRSKDKGSVRSNVAKQVNEHAAEGSNNATSQAENASENASNAAENASSNAAEAHANAPGKNK